MSIKKRTAGTIIEGQQKGQREPDSQTATEWLRDERRGEWAETVAIVRWSPPPVPPHVISTQSSPSGWGRVWSHRGELTRARDRTADCHFDFQSWNNPEAPKWRGITERSKRCTVEWTSARTTSARTSARIGKVAPLLTFRSDPVSVLNQDKNIRLRADTTEDAIHPPSTNGLITSSSSIKLLPSRLFFFFVRVIFFPA